MEQAARIRGILTAFINEATIAIGQARARREEADRKTDEEVAIRVSSKPAQLIWKI